MAWYLESLIGTIAFAAMMLLIKQLSRLGASSPQILLYIFSCGAVCFLLHLSFQKEQIFQGKDFLILVSVAAFLSYIGNLFYIRSTAHAPNPGYAMILNGLQSVIVVFVSVLFFGSHLGIKQIIGTILCFIGAALLVL